MRHRFFITWCWVTVTATAVLAGPLHSQREVLPGGPIEMVIATQPETIALHRDALLTVKIIAPEHIAIELPPSLAVRLQGFELRGDREMEPVTRDGTVIRERQCLLTPVVAREYRLAPFPVRYTDHSQTPPGTGWLATQPVVFVVEKPAASGDGITDALDPVRIWPGPRTWVLYAAIAVALAVLALGLARLMKRAERAIRVWRMSPRERALKELDELLTRKLVEQGLVKAFYLELTLVVRRYIERAHKVRAPELTTQEFLDAASASPRFNPQALSELQRFLEAADLVKFAACQPPQDDIDAACQTARRYIETDAAAADSEEPTRIQHV